MDISNPHSDCLDNVDSVDHNTELPLLNTYPIGMCFDTRGDADGKALQDMVADLLEESVSSSASNNLTEAFTTVTLNRTNFTLDLNGTLGVWETLGSTSGAMTLPLVSNGRLGPGESWEQTLSGGLNAASVSTPDLKPRENLLSEYTSRGGSQVPILSLPIQRSAKTSLCSEKSNETNETNDMTESPTAALPAHALILKAELEMASGATLTIVDPHRRKLHVPLSAVIPTNALNNRHTQPSLCLLFQAGRCRQNRNCFQAHVAPEVVEALRALNDQQPTCCAMHGDVNASQWNATSYNHRSITVGDVEVPMNQLAFTVGLTRILRDSLAPLGAGLLCRMHGIGSGCRFGSDCKFLHVCHEFVRGPLAPILERANQLCPLEPRTRQQRLSPQPMSRDAGCCVNLPSEVQNQQQSIKQVELLHRPMTVTMPGIVPSLAGPVDGLARCGSLEPQLCSISTLDSTGQPQELRFQASQAQRLQLQYHHLALSANATAQASVGGGITTQVSPLLPPAALALRQTFAPQELTVGNPPSSATLQSQEAILPHHNADGTVSWIRILHCSSPSPGNAVASHVPYFVTNASQVVPQQYTNFQSLRPLIAGIPTVGSGPTQGLAATSHLTHVPQLSVGALTPGNVLYGHPTSYSAFGTGPHC